MTSFPKILPALFLIFHVLGGTCTAQTGFRSVHERAVVVDGHNDVIGSALKGRRIDARSDKGHSDIPRFKEGGVDVQLFSIWVPRKYANAKNAFPYAIREVDSLDAIIGRNTWDIAKVTGKTSLVQTLNRNAIAAIYAVEGCHAADGSLENIRTLYKRGVRVFGLTWNNSTIWSHSSPDETAGKGKGITTEGTKLIALLDSLGAFIDVSHSGEQSFWDAVHQTKRPVIASHSSCAALRAHHRNLTDDQIKAVAATGGIMMINYCPSYIVSGVTKSTGKQIGAYEAKLKAAEKNLRLDSPAYLRTRDSLILDARKHGLPTILDVADHIMHAIDIAGIEHVGLGSDFDGIGYAPFGLRDVTQLPYLTRELLKRGISKEHTAKILGGNFVRIFSQYVR